MTSVRQELEVVVVGGGPAGLTVAIALAAANVPTVLVAGRPRLPDNRTTALLGGSVTALETLRVWEKCRDHAAPFRAIRLIDDTARLLRAPEVVFEASEIGIPAFGHTIENRFLLAAMVGRARELASLTVMEDDAARIEVDDDAVRVHLDGGRSVAARLAVGADGRRSLCRTAAGVETDGWRYPQTALTFNLGHSRPHDNTSTEFHTESGPFTLVPLPGLRSSLVFVLGSEDADRIAALPDGEMAAEIERRSHSILGKITLENGYGAFPLAVEVARSLGAGRVALVGEAAHVLPPIGAQGLNLGLRDAATISELVVAAHRDGRDVGGADVTSRYERMRRADVSTRALAVDLFNRSLLSDFLPVQSVRGFGLAMMERIGPLRRAAMREGVTPAASQPRLMRGEAL